VNQKGVYFTTDKDIVIPTACVDTGVRSNLDTEDVQIVVSAAKCDVHIFEIGVFDPVIQVHIEP